MDKQANEELVPCPICNSHDISMGYYGGCSFCSSWGEYRISCRNCGLNLPYIIRERGIESWNTRSTPLVALDREDAEKHADNIWEQCASTSAIADYLQAKFGSLSARIPS